GVILTPHEAANSPQSLMDLRREMCQATVDWLTGGWTSAVVNPQVRDRPRGVRPAESGNAGAPAR
ncbi:MAG: hypothetical protein ACYDAG_10745, partial [Chloroflexota bacterium]